MNYIDEQRDANGPDEGAYSQLCKSRAHAFLNLPFLEEDHTILDVGSRTGAALKELQKAHKNVTGIELVPEFAKEAGAQCGNFLTTDLEEVDWIFASHVVEHFNQPKEGRDKLFDLAKLGVFLVTPMELEEHFKANPSHHFHAFWPEEWLDWLRNPKFTLFCMQAFPEYGDILWVFLRRQAV